MTHLPSLTVLSATATRCFSSGPNDWKWCGIINRSLTRRCLLLLKPALLLLQGVYHPPTDGRPPVTDASAKAWVPEPTAVQAEALSKFKEILEAGGGAVSLEQDMELFRFRKASLRPLSPCQIKEGADMTTPSHPSEHLELRLGLAGLPRTSSDRRVRWALSHDLECHC